MTPFNEGFLEMFSHDLDWLFLFYLLLEQTHASLCHMCKTNYFSCSVPLAVDPSASCWLGSLGVGGWEEETYVSAGTRNECRDDKVPVFKRLETNKASSGPPLHWTLSGVAHWLCNVPWIRNVHCSKRSSLLFSVKCLNRTYCSLESV